MPTSKTTSLSLALILGFSVQTFGRIDDPPSKNNADDVAKKADARPKEAAVPEKLKQSFVGHWEGAIKTPGTELKVDLDFSIKPDGVLIGDISIPSQALKDVALIKIKLDESGAYSFEIDGIPGKPTFSGKTTGDAKKMTGDFSQGGLKFPFELSSEPKPSVAMKDSLEGFDSFVESAIKSWKVPGVAIAVVKDGETIYAKGFGFRNVAAKEPVTPNTVFSIGSCTKAFTTFVMATLVDEGKLDWDKPLREYLPGFQTSDPVATNQLTPRDLVSHRSGMPRHDLMWYNSAFTRKEMVDRLAYLEFTAPIRSKFQYNNLMFLTAGYLIEQISGGTWEDAVRKRIFEPLEMKSSVLSILDVKKLENFAVPYDERENVVVEIPFREIANIGPAGSISSSVEDMSHWVSMLVGKGKFGSKALVGPSVVSELFVPTMVMGSPSQKPEAISEMSYGLGWMIDTYRGHKRVHHGGNIDGFSAETVLFPEDGLGLVVLSNHNATPVPSLVGRHAADRLLKLPTIDWNGEALAKKAIADAAGKQAKAKKATLRKLGTVPSHKLDDYVGDFSHPGYGLVKVWLKDGVLWMRYNSIEAPLEHWHYDVFNAGKNPADPAFEDSKVQFSTGLSGSIDALEAALEPAVKPIHFSRAVESKLSDPEYLQKFTGEYELAGSTAKVGLKGKFLTFQLATQPVSELIPTAEGDFLLKIASVIRVRFVQDADGKVTAAEVDQPNGLFTAKKTK